MALLTPILCSDLMANMKTKQKNIFPEWYTWLHEWGGQILTKPLVIIRTINFQKGCEFGAWHSMLQWRAATCVLWENTSQHGTAYYLPIKHFPKQALQLPETWYIFLSEDSVIVARRRGGISSTNFFPLQTKTYNSIIIRCCSTLRR